jgi:hypothetical protein
MQSQWVVLVTDFVTAQLVYGPFLSRESATRWADEHLRDVYRVFEMKPVTAATPEEPAPTFVEFED